MYDNVGQSEHQTNYLQQIKSIPNCLEFRLVLGPINYSSLTFL